MTSTRVNALDPAVREAALRFFTYGHYAVTVSCGDERNVSTANWLTQVQGDGAPRTMDAAGFRHAG